jgi:GGDEF domain-containing protein
MAHLPVSDPSSFSAPEPTRGRRVRFLRSRPSPVGRDLTAQERASVPRWFEAVAEGLVAGDDAASAAAEVGRTLAADGASLGEALSGLRACTTELGLGEPSFTATEALATAWSEATLAFLSDVSCEDPLTGLSSAAHLRARLEEIYRAADLVGASVRASHALLVADVGDLAHHPDHHTDHVGTDPFAHALTLAGVAEAVRGVFPGEETLARVGHDKVVALVRRPAHLGATVVELRGMLEDLGFPGTRIWVEALPDDATMAAQALAGLALLGH